MTSETETTPATKTLHTPGPWILKGEDKPVGSRDTNQSIEYCGSINPARENGEGYRGDICRFQSSNCIQGITAAECEANARLATAAPEMLAALQNIENDGGVNIPQSAWELIRYAINLATVAPSTD